MSRDIILKDKQTGYDVVAECVREYWDQTYYGTVIVWMAISNDGEKYCRFNEVVIPQDGDIEFLNDWWEGEKYIKIYGIANLDDIEMTTADVVEVVRCKDCKHLTVVNNESVYARCEKTGYIFGSFETDTREHFCAYGERRENGKS